ncbi:hornerin-like [Penaeus indicus]|uniref:hornerin-like n=1 Tax=Penaeus indicus TaxID=29960 RepID=UPI00300C3571
MRVGTVTLALVAACSAWPTFLPKEKLPHPAPGFSFHSNSTSSNSSSSSNQNSASGNYTSTGSGFNFSHSSSNSSSSSADHSSSSSFSGFFSGGNSNGGAAFFGNSGSKFPFDFHSLFAGGQVPVPGAQGSSVGNEGASSSTQLSSANSQGSPSHAHGSQASQTSQFAAGVSSADVRPDGSGSPVNTQDSPSFIVTTSNLNTVTPSSVGVHFTTDDPAASSATESTAYFKSTTFVPEGSTHKSFSHLQFGDDTKVKSADFASGQTPQDLITQPGPKISTAGTRGLLSGKDTSATNSQELLNDKEFGFASFQFQTTTVSFQPDTQEAVTAVTPSGLDLPLDGFQKDHFDHSTGTQGSSIQLETGSQRHQNDKHVLTDAQQSQDSHSRTEGIEYDFQSTQDTPSTGLQQPSFDYQSETEDSGAISTDFLNVQQTKEAQKPEFLLKSDVSDAENQEASFRLQDTTQTSSFGFPSNTNHFASATDRSAVGTGSSILKTGSSSEYQSATNSFSSSTQAPISSDVPASPSASQFDYDYHTDDSTTFLSTSPVVTKPAFPPFPSSAGDLPAPEIHLPSTEFQVGISDSSVQVEVPSSGVQSDFSLSGSGTSAPEFQFNTGFSLNQDYDTQESSYSEQPNTHSGISDVSVNIHALKSGTHNTRELASGSELVPDSPSSVQRTIGDEQSNVHSSPAETHGFFGLHSAALGPSITTEDQSFQTDLPGASADYDTQEAALDIHQGTFTSISDVQENSGDFNNRDDDFLSNSRDSSQGNRGDTHGSATGGQHLIHDLQHDREESQSGHNYDILGPSTTEPSFGLTLAISASATSDSNQGNVNRVTAGTGGFHEDTERDSSTAHHGLSSGNNHGLITDDQDPTTGIHSTAFIKFGSTVDEDYDLLVDSQDLTTGVQGAATSFEFPSTDSQNFDVNVHDPLTNDQLSSTDIHAPDTHGSEANNPLLSTDSYTDDKDLFSSTVDHDSDQTSSADQFLTASNQFSTDESQLSSDSDNSDTVNQFSTGGNQFLSPGSQFSSAANQFSSDDYDSPVDNQFLSSANYDASAADNQFSSIGHQLSSTTNQLSSSDNHEVDNQFSSDSTADSQFSSSVNKFSSTDNEHSSSDDYDNQFSSTSNQFSPFNNFDSSNTQFTSINSQVLGSTDSATEDQSSSFDKYDSAADGQFKSDSSAQISPSDNRHAATGNPFSSGGSHDSQVGAHFSASGSQGSLFAFTSSGQASGSSSGYASHGVKRPSSLGQRSGSGVVGSSGLTGFIVHLTGKGSVHAGSCPTLRKDCDAGRSAPKTCLNDSSCGPSEKCCFDTCSAALWVCTPSVVPA